MDTRTFTTEQVIGFNICIRDWIVNNGTAKMLEDFDKQMQYWLPKGPPTPPSAWQEFTNFLYICFLVGIFMFAIIGLIGVGFHLGMYLVG